MIVVFNLAIKRFTIKLILKNKLRAFFAADAIYLFILVFGIISGQFGHFPDDVKNKMI